MSIANVLLVDDEVSFVETFSERLEMRNLEISKAFSGEEALQVLEQNHNIEVIILDVRTGGDWKSSEFKIQGAIRTNPNNFNEWAEVYPKNKTLVLYCA